LLRARYPGSHSSPGSSSAFPQVGEVVSPVESAGSPLESVELASPVVVVSSGPVDVDVLVVVLPVALVVGTVLVGASVVGGSGSVLGDMLAPGSTSSPAGASLPW